MSVKESVFPIDFSDRSVDVCPYVAALTQRLKAKLTVLHVIENPAPGSSPLDRLPTGDQAELEQRKESANRALRAFQQQYIPHVTSDLCVLSGDPAESIVAYGGQGEGRMKELLTSTARSTILAPTALLDLATGIKVSQAVSGEMVLKKLIDSLMRPSIEHAGAERGLLIVSRRDELQIEAEAITADSDVTVHLRDGADTTAAMRSRSSVM